MTGHEHALPAGPLLSWYGDDFTGAAAVMEVLSLAGLPSVLFCDPPSPQLLTQFAGFRGIGIAGVARSMSPQWMDQNLPPVFAALAQLRAPITHYKVCSTLDSSPLNGSIGRAIELAAPYFDPAWIPVLMAAPVIDRYQLFGNLFAAVDDTGYRLDRHPTMSRHPVTPMTEADVRVHLGKQTTRPMGLIDFLALRNGDAAKRLQLELAAGRGLTAIDTIDEASLIAAGKLIWEHRGERLFAVGSQGIEYALIAYWRSVGLMGAETRAPRAAAVERIAVVSGSCSPVTARQIDWAEKHGFAAIRLDVRQALDGRMWPGALSAACRQAVRAVDSGRDPLVFSARGPDDPAIAAFFDAVEVSGEPRQTVNERIGQGLGFVLDAVVRETGIPRGILAGGDTSGHGAKALGVRALTLSAPVVPGAGLFRAYMDDPDCTLREIALKGGQMGPADYFGQIKNGGVAVAHH